MPAAGPQHRYGHGSDAPRGGTPPGVGVHGLDFCGSNAKDLYGFKKRMAAAEQGYVEKLEAEADRRGVEGIDEMKQRIINPAQRC